MWLLAVGLGDGPNGRFDAATRRSARCKVLSAELCVTAMAKLANEQTSSPSKACKAESKKHVDGQKGTPFSKCVVAGAKLLNDQT